jgi:hypothetical protein
VNPKLFEVSKNAINDILLLSRKAQVIRTSKGTSLAVAPVSLQLTGARLVREAIVHCDAVYLQTIQMLEEPFDIEEAALALYDSTSYVTYLQAVLQQKDQGYIETS